MKSIKKIWNWIKARPIISGVAAVAPIAFDIVAGGCMLLGPFAAMGPWGWAALPVVWGLEALATIIIARSMIGETITGTLAKTSLVTGLATWVATLAFSPLAGWLAWTSVGTSVGTVISALVVLKKKAGKGEAMSLTEMAGVASEAFKDAAAVAAAA